MNLEKAKELEPGKEVFFAGAFYEVAELKQFQHGLMVGIYDEKPANEHIDYLKPESIHEVVPCHSCQGGGCVVCNGFGKLVNP